MKRCRNLIGVFRSASAARQASSPASVGGLLRMETVGRWLIRRAAGGACGWPRVGQAGGRRLAEGPIKPVEGQTPERQSPGEARARWRCNSPSSDDGRTCGAKPRGGGIRRMAVLARTSGRIFNHPSVRICRNADSTASVSNLWRAKPRSAAGMKQGRQGWAGSNPPRG